MGLKMNWSNVEYVFVTEQSIKNGYDSDSTKKLLEVGKKYELVDWDESSCYTALYLKEFPRVAFNSVLFEIDRSTIGVFDLDNDPVSIIGYFGFNNGIKILNRFRKWVNKVDEEFKDSFRIRLVEDNNRDEYEELIGCCGQIDEIIKINIDGNRLKFEFGCNFGH